MTRRLACLSGEVVSLVRKSNAWSFNLATGFAPLGAGCFGFAAILLYAPAKDPTAYAASFHDIAAGDNTGTCKGLTGTSSAVCSVLVNNPATGVTAPRNTWATAAGGFSAVAGYDLATGLGTPQCAILNELATGAKTATAATPVTTRYHRTGACNGFTTPTGITSAGGNQAYVVFGIERIDNGGGATPFAFDPTKLYVQQAIRNVVDPSLGIYANVLGPFAAVSTSVGAGQNLGFEVSAEAALVVQTVNANGATEANNTAYSLRYDVAATDPPVVLTRSDAGQTTWPDTEDCKTIALH